MTTKLFTILTALLLFPGPGELIRAQGASTALMNVMVEVVPAASFSRTDSTNIFNVPAKGNEIHFGEFSLVIPEGVQVLTSSSGSVSMTNGESSWMMDSIINKNLIEEKGLLNFRFSTDTSSPKEIENGLYKGVQVTTIEYL